METKQFDRLPKYAREYISQLEGELADCMEKLTNVEDSPISYPLDIHEDVPVPSRNVDVRVGGFELDVLAQDEQVRLTWQGVAFIVPMASNCIYLAGEKSPYVR